MLFPTVQFVQTNVKGKTSLVYYRPFFELQQLVSKTHRGMDWYLGGCSSVQSILGQDNIPKLLFDAFIGRWKCLNAG